MPPTTDTYHILVYPTGPDTGAWYLRQPGGGMAEMGKPARMPGTNPGGLVALEIYEYIENGWLGTSAAQAHQFPIVRWAEIPAAFITIDGEVKFPKPHTNYGSVQEEQPTNLTSTQGGFMYAVSQDRDPSRGGFVALSYVTAYQATLPEYSSEGYGGFDDAAKQGTRFFRIRHDGKVVGDTVMQDEYYKNTGPDGEIFLTRRVLLKEGTMYLLPDQEEDVVTEVGILGEAVSSPGPPVSAEGFDVSPRDEAPFNAVIDIAGRRRLAIRYDPDNLKRLEAWPIPAELELLYPLFDAEGPVVHIKPGTTSPAEAIYTISTGAGTRVIKAIGGDMNDEAGYLDITNNLFEDLPGGIKAALPGGGTVVALRKINI